MEQFLYFFEDGNFKVSGSPNEADLQAVREGFLSIIDLDARMYYNGSNWTEIEVLKEVVESEGGN